MENVYGWLSKQADYALASRSKSLVYECYGAAKMARELDAITKEQMQVLNDRLVRCGLNNPKAGLR